MNWRTGVLLDTPRTRAWTADEREAAQAREACGIYEDFSATDAGRSRRRVAECETPEQAREIVATVRRLADRVDVLVALNEGKDARIAASEAALATERDRAEAEKIEVAKDSRAERDIWNKLVQTSADRDYAQARANQHEVAYQREYKKHGELLAILGEFFPGGSDVREMLTRQKDSLAAAEAERHGVRDMLGLSSAVSPERVFEEIRDIGDALRHDNDRADAALASLAAAEERARQWEIAANQSDSTLQVLRGDRDAALARAQELEEENVRLRQFLEAMLPNAEGQVTNKLGVEWGAACGRHYLQVAAVAVAMEGDPNREEGGAWTDAQIRGVVERFAAPIRAVLAQGT